MRSVILILLAAALALAPHASAQVPEAPTPIYTVAIMNAAGEFPALAANGTGEVGFDVVLTAGNMVCSADVVVPVTVTATAAGAPSNFALTLEPAVLNFTIATGPHGSGTVGGPGGGTQPAIVRASIAGNITANASVQVTLVANAPAPAGPPQGCQGAGPAIGSATSAPVVVFANLTATPQPPPPPSPEEDTPALGLVAVAAVAVGVALLRRKRD